MTEFSKVKPGSADMIRLFWIVDCFGALEPPMISVNGIPCPSCGKHFKNNTRLLQHINQPTSRCREKRRNLRLIRISYSTAMEQRHGNRSNRLNSTGNRNSNTVGFDLDKDIYQNGNDNDQFSINADNFDDGSRGLAVGGGVERGQVVESCPNVPCVYTGGTTFMKGFDQDSYASRRSEAPWYPFASQNDWEVAYWLMRTGLSMAEIDGYLNLNFVSFPLVFLSLRRAHMLQFHVRRRRLPFRSAAPRSYDNGLKCYHRAHDGNTRTL